MNQMGPDGGEVDRAFQELDSSDPNLHGTGDESPQPANSASNLVPPGVRKQFGEFREASLTAFHNVSSKVEQAAQSEKGQKMQQDIHYGFEKIGIAVENCWNWTKEHVEPAAKEIGENTKYLFDHAFGEGKTPPPPSYTGYQFHVQTEEQTKNEAHDDKDVYVSGSPTLAVMHDSSTFAQNIPDDESDKLLVAKRWCEPHNILQEYYRNIFVRVPTPDVPSTIHH